jgi:hypothetical protein
MLAAARRPDRSPKRVMRGAYARLIKRLRQQLSGMVGMQITSIVTGSLVVLAASLNQAWAGQAQQQSAPVVEPACNPEFCAQEQIS